MSRPGSCSRTLLNFRVVAWALWDTGSTGLNAIVATFVFAVYLTDAVGEGLSGGTSPTSWLGRAFALSGLTIALLAPAIGVWVEAPHRRRVALGVLTGLAVALTSMMSLIRDDPAYLLPGLVLLAATVACSDLASVPYNAMLRQLSTPQTVGRISGLGWASGYVGSVLLLVLMYVSFMSGTGPERGLLHLPAEDGINVRAAMLLAAAWLAVFALPLLTVAHRLPETRVEPAIEVSSAQRPISRMLGSYRKLWNDISAEWHRDRNLVYFLFASAIFRDGLAAMTAFAAVLGVNVYGLALADVLIFGVAASLAAALGAVVGGFVDHRIGSKPVIVASLAAIITLALTLLALSGPLAFWICALLLCLFIGPSQSSARALLLHMAQRGKEGMAFGLYTMTGRAVSFLGPWLFSVFVDLFHADRAGLGGVCLVLTAGLLVMLRVRVPRRDGAVAAESI